MDNLSIPELILLIAVGYLALTVLTRMMVAHRDKVTKRVRDALEKEQRQKRKAAQKKSQSKGDDRSNAA